jgi:hypothetical protein
VTEAAGSNFFGEACGSYDSFEPLADPPYRLPMPIDEPPQFAALHERQQGACYRDNRTEFVGLLSTFGIEVHVPVLCPGSAPDGLFRLNE